VEHVTRDENEVYTVFCSLLAQLLEGGESGFADPTACALLEPSDSQTQVQIRGMQESYHLRGSIQADGLPDIDFGLVFLTLYNKTHLSRWREGIQFILVEQACSLSSVPQYLGSYRQAKVYRVMLRTF